MDIVDGLKLVARWWFVTVPIVVMALIGAVAITSNIQPEFRAEGAVLFVGPSVTASTADGEATVVNPLLTGSSGLTTAAEISTLALNTPEVARILANEGYSPSFAIGSASRSPILFIEALAPNRDLATATAMRVTQLIEQDLQLRQDAAGVSQDQRISTNVISLSAVGGADYGARLRIRLAIVAFGTGLAVGAAFLFEGVARRRRASRRAMLHAGQIDRQAASAQTDVGGDPRGGVDIERTDARETRSPDRGATRERVGKLPGGELADAESAVAVHGSDHRVGGERAGGRSTSRRSVVRDPHERESRTADDASDPNAEPAASSGGPNGSGADEPVRAGKSAHAG